MDELIRVWGRISGSADKLRFNHRLLRFLGSNLYEEYQPFPEKAQFWDRLYLWLDQIPADTDRESDQQALFNFVPWLLFVGEAEMISMYRAAFTGPVCQWLIEVAKVKLNSVNLTNEIALARQDTWFGSLAGFDINTFCRVNHIFGQSFRPEFRFVTKFCSVPKLRKWLRAEGYKRIVVVEDMIGSGEQLEQAIESLIALKTFKILIVPLFIAPDGWRVAQEIEAKYKHIRFSPLFVLPDPCLVYRDQASNTSDELRNLSELITRRDAGRFGYAGGPSGGTYGTLVLSNLNCPDNVPPLVWQRTALRPNPLFPRASREG